MTSTGGAVATTSREQPHSAAERKRPSRVRQTIKGVLSAALVVAIFYFLAVLIGGLVAAGGAPAEVTAAVLIYRALTWGLPILVGIIAFLWWRRRSTTPRPANGQQPTETKQPPVAGGQ